MNVPGSLSTRLTSVISISVIICLTIFFANIIESPLIKAIITLLTISILYLLMSRPLIAVIKLSQIAKELSLGNVNVEIPIININNNLHNNNIYTLATSLKKIQDNISTLSDEMNRVDKEINKGNLQARGDISLVDGKYKSIITKNNELLDIMYSYLDNIPLPLVIFNADIRFSLINKLARAQGFDSKNLLGKTLIESIPKNESEAMLPHFKHVIQTGQNFNYHMTMIAPTGETLIEEHHLTPLHSKKNELVSLLLINFDISDMINSKNKAEKINDYQVLQAKEITKNLEQQLSKGILKFIYEPETRDVDTADSTASYKQIGDALRYATTFIKGYVDEISHIMQEFSNENFNISVNQNYLGDFSTIKDSMETLIFSISSLISEIKVTSAEVENVATFFATSTNKIMFSFEEQVNTIDSMHGAMKRLREKTEENANQTNQANNLSKNVQSAAQAGKQHMKEMSLAMEDINHSSKKILGIVKVIEDIAFQTNLLALNAAVEAARAGDHGKGFAVVAEEVRDLANRSANAVKETSSLLDESIVKVHTGVNITSQTANSLQEIESITGDVATLISSIALASQEQAEEISRINRDMGNVYDKTIDNNNLLQSNAATSQQLSAQSQQLSALVAKFKTKH